MPAKGLIFYHVIIFMINFMVDKFVLGSLPQRVDFGALGITELKFNCFWYECIINDETRLCGNFQVDKQTNEVWQQMKLTCC